MMNRAWVLTPVACLQHTVKHLQTCGTASCTGPHQVELSVVNPTLRDPDPQRMQTQLLTWQRCSGLPQLAATFSRVSGVTCGRSVATTSAAARAKAIATTPG
jgi:hypothetical protein